MAERKSVTREMAHRYQDGTKGQKTVILNELCTLTGWTRRHTELRALNELYEVLGLWVNFFSPQQRLTKKVRRGAKVTRYHDVAATPFQRLLASEHVSEDAKIALGRT